jgi:hypothetical protein
MITFRNGDITGGISMDAKVRLKKENDFSRRGTEIILIFECIFSFFLIFRFQV